ncbi:MAG: isoprenylcysteine carboxylmethyltransferase family protein [Candidatus Gracilibacteria bacterium]|nr:isoprenylcysteine carboxylmethyltransferase family protein [Candidatus Gracilibacteria bacterium]
MKNFLKNYFSTVLFLILAYIFFFNNKYYSDFLIKDFSLRFTNFSINTLIIYKGILIAYFVLLIPFYIYFKDKSKARVIINFLHKKIKNIEYSIQNDEKVSILAWSVKLFFAPLMIVWLTGQIFTLLNNMYLGYNDLFILKDSFYLFFQKHLFWGVMSIILFVDLIFFTIGYLIEIPILKNKIKSVEPTFLGWFIVLICYPPFNTHTTSIIGWYSTEFPKFGNEYAHIFLNIIILFSMGIYSWASLSLGFKASNLTNRGIVKKGPYKYIRHPAYISKNIAWWIGGLPILIGNIFTGQYKHFFIVFFSLSVWTFIYYMRAITEERHLSLDEDYIKYKKEVKYKFIPKVF